MKSVRSQFFCFFPCPKSKSIKMPSVRRSQTKKAAEKVESEEVIQDSVLDEFKAEFGCDDVEDVLSDDASLSCASGDEEEKDDGVVVSFQDESGSEAESEKAVSESEEEQDEPKDIIPLKLDAKTEAKMKRKIKGASVVRGDEEKGVVFLGRIPHGLSIKRLTTRILRGTNQ
jgi:hypothetical protein